MLAIAKGVSDAVHGTIELSEVEARVISTRAFQRLRNVKQLGLAYMVFPGADYSRFAHSLGVCHVTKRIIAALQQGGVKFSPEEEQRYRLAALLHDVGHYPFSHAMEEAVQDHYSGLLTNSDVGSSEEAKWLNHESVGKEVLRENEELRTALNDAGFTPEEIYQIFAREQPPRFANLISSDLDADRTDYLLRTAHHTGLTYGAVDLDYLLSQLRVDNMAHICLHPKALRTADHFLLGRYFDYQQVAFHKTVAALEWVLVEVIKGLLAEGHLRCSASEVTARIKSSGWESFDDTYLFHLIRGLAAETENESMRRKAEAILYRRPPKLIGQVEYLDRRDKQTAKSLRAQRKVILEQIEVWASEFGIAKDLWHVWEGGLTFTKVGANVPISAMAADTEYGSIDADKTEQAIRILNPATGLSQPIMNERRSLMSVLSDRALYSLRLYVVLPPEREHERTAIEQRVREDLKDEVDWL